jgi:(p)ppGpp synthase/HD superfamily hydrolase
MSLENASTRASSSTAEDHRTPSVDQPPADLDLDFLQDLPLTRAAAKFAGERHGRQRRQGDRAPFIVHPLEVAAELHRCGYPDHVIAAAVLHDVLEDTNATRIELQAQFGTHVSELVALVSDDPSTDDEEAQKADTRERVSRAGDEALAIYSADKISKVRELRTLKARGLPHTEAEIKLRRYQKSLAMLEQTIPHSSLVELLRFELQTLERLPPEPHDPGNAA